jgi:hypothetical protein
LKDAKVRPAVFEVEVPMPEAFSARDHGTPAASAINVPCFKNFLRELLICVLLGKYFELRCGQNGGAVYFFFVELAIKKT